jgi:hypothetical protein
VTPTEFLQHWSIVENPFRDEEARNDAVLARMALDARRATGNAARPGAPAASGRKTPAQILAEAQALAVAQNGEPSRPAAPDAPGGTGPAGGGTTAVNGRAGEARPGDSRADRPSVGAPAEPRASLAAAAATFHSDFEKIVGDFRRPSTAVVFGEKGSGKTAIRLQLAARVEEFNREHPESRMLFVPYDSLGAMLDQLHQVVQGKTALESLQKIRLVDHLDGILHTITPPIVDAFLGIAGVGGAVNLGFDARRPARRLDAESKRALLLLQVLYDRPDGAVERTRALRSRLGVWLPAGYLLLTLAAFLGWIPAAGLYLWARFAPLPGFPPLTSINALTLGILGLAALWLLAVAKRSVWDRVALLRMAKRIRKQLRVVPRGDLSYMRALRQLAPRTRDPANLPITDSDAPRYAMTQGLRRILRPFGYAGIIVVVDRIDEPSIVSGDADRMRAIVWPMLANRFLQQEGIGMKLLLPIELRYALFRESSAFFQEARLDKQSMVERLSWTGAMLYDLCNARLQACRSAHAGPVALLDLFEEDVTRQDLVDALDQMHQPREAFKFMYRCLTEHCAGVTADQSAYRIPRHVLEHVKKQEADRVQQLYRGIRPA